MYSLSVMVPARGTVLPPDSLHAARRIPGTAAGGKDLSSAGEPAGAIW